MVKSGGCVKVFFFLFVFCYYRRARYVLDCGRSSGGMKKVLGGRPVAMVIAGEAEAKAEAVG